MAVDVAIARPAERDAEPPAAPAPLAGRKLKVFISYARGDASEFADELLAGLQLAGFAPYLDRHDIAAGEDWEIRLGNLILEADTVVFVVSPEAAASASCRWEVERTDALGKRLLSVIWKPVPDAQIPERLRRIQFVRFDDGLGITRPLTQLADALRIDLDWIREHTRQGELAARWAERGREKSLLLRGNTILTCKAWQARRAPGAPEITALMHEFFAASEEEEKQQQDNERQQLERMRLAVEQREAAVAEAELASRRAGRWRVLAGMMTLAVPLGLLAGYFAVSAERSRRVAEASAQRAQREFERAQSEADAANRYAKVLAISSQNKEGIRAMRENCREAAEVTATLAATVDKTVLERSTNRFWELYYGNMLLAEATQRKASGNGTSPIEAAMVRFGRGLQAGNLGDDALPRSALCPLASAVRQECVAFLEIVAPEPCQ